MTSAGPEADQVVVSAAAAARATCLAEVEHLRQERTAVQREHEEFLRQVRTQAAERAAAARSGVHGPDAQQLQQRLDAGETSAVALLAGRDSDPGAVRALERWNDVVTAWAEDREVAQRMAPGV